MNEQQISIRAALEGELHSLAQPLTSLQFRLEIGLFYGEAEGAREAIVEGMVELERVCAAVTRLRELVMELPLMGGQGQ